VAYTSPTTRSTGNSISAAQWNADMVDNIKWLAGDTSGKPSCRLYNSALQVIPNNTATAITFDSEAWDKGGLHSTVSQTSRITIPTGAGGVWDIGGCVEFAANAAGYRAAYILMNGTTILVNSLVPANSGSATTVLNPNTTHLINAGSFLELIVVQTSGGNLDANRTASYSVEFWAKWCGVL
jgi:hypothetical protein